MLHCTQFDNAIRWKPGERLQHLFEARCDQLMPAGEGGHPAVITANGEISYKTLDDRANQLARYLLSHGVKPGERIGLLFEKTPDTYVALLAVLKINAAYVPLDASFPPARIAFILEDAGVETVLTLSAFQDKFATLDISPVLLDASQRDIAAQSPQRLTQKQIGPPDDELCYIIYTSGSTGNPKGVAVEHSSICNFVQVASEVYGISKQDRVYQGLTIACDFSVEEIWIALNTGATLVPGPAGPSLLGKDLSDFLLANDITTLCCVPTLLATIEEDIPGLRFLLVSGEACPEDLAARWHRDGRTILNAYGPTEATVTATWTELRPGKPVTIGQPMPTYSIVILDQEKDETVASGEVGEIGITGIGLAKGYVNQKELTAEKFIPDFLDAPNNPSGRIYWTGDLGRINQNNEIEFLGRIDTQVKIRGYRIELGEIESVLLLLPSIDRAVVTAYAPEGGPSELVAYYALKPDTPPPTRSSIADVLQTRLPSYMVPSYLEELAEIPLLPNGKADRNALPAPSGRRLAVSGGAYIPPAGFMEESLAKAAADILGVEQVSVEDDFFQDLGAHSLLMTRFAAEIRSRKITPDVSMRDIYLHPTVRQLASHFAAGPSAQYEYAPQTGRDEFRVPKAAEYYLCGALQLLFYTLYSAVTIIWFVEGIEWTLVPSGMVGQYFRLSGFFATTFILFSGIPILLKWLLVGRWKAGKIPLWSLRYFRFWLVKQLVQINPMALFSGTEFYNIYLRLLGARIGRNVVNYAKGVPVCTDLITIGDNSVLQKESVLLGYTAQAGYLCMGPITLGAATYVGEAAVLDIGTAMGDGAQLGHRSALLPGQIVPCGKRYHGCPGQETTTDFHRVEAKPCSTLRRILYPAIQLAVGTLIYLPGLILASYAIFESSPDAKTIAVFPDLLAASLAGYFGMLVLGLAFVVSVPRLLNGFLEPEKTYPLYGFHYLIFRYIHGITNSKTYNVLFGDSSYIVHYFKWIGYELNEIVQTGSNFGTYNTHDTPFLCDVGSGTVVSDGLSMMNAHISSSSFRLSKAAIGARNYLGNDVIFPSDAKTGDNCLLATKVMIPIDGPVRENIGLLGSPSFEIPRSTNRDTRQAVIGEGELRKRLHKKNTANLKTIAVHLFFRWLFFFLASVAAFYTWPLYQTFGTAAFIVAMTVFSVLSIGYLILVERISLGFKPLKPRTCSIYDPYFWRIEHYWKVSESGLDAMFSGTPFKNVVSRLLGVKVGAMVYDGGAQATERTLVEIDDYCILNEGTILQSHSLEEGVFKSDYIRLGTGCTTGTKAYVHYGVTMGDYAVLGADSFLMKGETPEPKSIWCGNPARVLACLREDTSQSH